MKYYSYENFKDDTNILIKNVKDFNPQVVVAIARGGLTLAHTMAEGLDIRDVQSIRTELYDGIQKRERITLFGRCELENKQRILVVDDIADSGETLEFVMTSLKKSYPNVEMKSCTLFYKKTSVIAPDFWINEANEWIDFFWESDFK
ncbi:MAG: xanthine phosphoribosyltransferase [Sulfurimonas sp.]|jgi:xanthine phosphoribosyltransferase|uniref:phosphoribosyltransferase n=1 Tax=Sulfurimonas sp. TaxID=2022749 RepID=UPI0039E6DF34